MCWKPFPRFLASRFLYPCLANVLRLGLVHITVAVLGCEMSWLRETNGPAPPWDFPMGSWQSLLQEPVLLSICWCCMFRGKIFPPSAPRYHLWHVAQTEHNGYSLILRKASYNLHFLSLVLLEGLYVKSACLKLLEYKVRIIYYFHACNCFTEDR